MSKRRVPIGTLQVEGGQPVVIKNKRVAAALEGLQVQATKMRDGWQRESTAHAQTREELRLAHERLAKLQNRVWVRIGEFLGLVKP